MKNLILWLWQFPQNLIGFIIIKIMKAKQKEWYDCVTKYYTCPLFYAGVSLGQYIVFDSRCPIEANDIKHEIGHQKQSLYLGWLYLIIIGLSSVIGNLWNRIVHKHWSYEQRNHWYYKKLPWEKWADKLGNVKR